MIRYNNYPCVRVARFRMPLNQNSSITLDNKRKFHKNCINFTNLTLIPKNVTSHNLSSTQTNTLSSSSIKLTINILNIKFNNLCKNLKIFQSINKHDHIFFSTSSRIRREALLRPPGYASSARVPRTDESFLAQRSGRKQLGDRDTIGTRSN